VKPETEEDQETLVGLIDSKEREVKPPGALSSASLASIW